MRQDIDDLFPAHIATVSARCENALQDCGFDGLVAYSGRERYYFLDDHPCLFKANPLFQQWIPLNDVPECFLRYLPGERPLLCFNQPADYWHLPAAVPEAGWTRSVEIKVTRQAAEAKSLLRCGGRRIAFLGEWQDEFETWGFAAVNPQNLIDHLHYYRAVKTDYEQQCMRRASEHGARGHLAARDAFRNGASEFEVHQAYCHAAGHREQELPYGNIVAFDRAAAVLHYQRLDRRRDVPRRSFLLDAGAQYRGYACDITRSYSGGNDDFAALIERMDVVEQNLCARVRPGVDYRDIHLEAHRLVAEALNDAGIVDCDTETAIERGVSAVFFPHGVGHLLGLQVHDVAGLAGDAGGGEIPRPKGHPHLRLTRCLEPGFVVTIEPGLYFIDLLLEAARSAPANEYIHWKRVEQLRPFGGIRIEDNVLCTKDEPENFSRQAFAAVEPDA